MRAAAALRRDKAKLNGDPVMGDNVDVREGSAAGRLVGVVAILGTAEEAMEEALEEPTDDKNATLAVAPEPLDEVGEEGR